jgi:hypothetical protein
MPRKGDGIREAPAVQGFYSVYPNLSEPSRILVV